MNSFLFNIFQAPLWHVLRQILRRCPRFVANMFSCRYNSDRKRGKSLEWDENRRTFAMSKGTNNLATKKEKSINN